MATLPPVIPPAITTLPTPPSTSDPANFDPRADAFLVALPNNQSQLNSLGNNVYDNALKTYNSATDSKTAADAAVPAATTATQAAATANASLTTMQKLYLGAKTSPPFLDNQGQPLQQGAWYTNLTDGYWYWWSGSSWKIGVGDLSTVDWNSQVINKPSTVSGYGITNAVTTSGNQSVGGLKVFSSTVTGKSSGNDSQASFFAKSTGGSFSNMWTRRGSPFTVEAESTGSSFSPAVTITYSHNTGWNGLYSVGTLNNGAADPGCFTITHLNSNAGQNTTLLFYGATGTLVASGDVTAFSDERLKYNWAPLSSTVLQDFSKVKYGTYIRKDTGQKQVGVSAQDMQKVIPEAVHEGSDGNLSLAYGNAALVICAELLKELSEVRNELAILKGVVNGIT